MTEAIKNIVAGYLTLKNRRAFEEIRDYRQTTIEPEPYARPELGQHDKDAGRSPGCGDF